MLNCRHMLERSRCPSEAKWVTAVQLRLFWNQQQSCQAPTLSPKTRAESISWASAPYGSARKQSFWEKEEWMIERGNEKKKKVRYWEKKKKRWKVFAFSLIISLLNSDGCGWICIALGWQWPTFYSPSFWITASAFRLCVSRRVLWWRKWQRWHVVRVYGLSPPFPSWCLMGLADSWRQTR